MDEVDKIIIQSLQQIDAIAADDEDAQYLAKFTPEIVVRAVSTCLQQILPGDKQTLPRSLPAAIAQRFSIATGLAEACTAAGYRGDIGYQTFLYPNTVDLRRLLMYLIEQLPRAQSIGGTESSAHTPLRHYELINAEIKGRILKELRMPWVPQYCRYIANRQSTTTTSSISQCTEFKPQLNLNIPSGAACEQSLEVREYFQQQAPNVFQQQQTAAGCYDLVSSVLHKNANDFYRPQQDQQLVLAALNLSQTSAATVTKSVISTKPNSQELEEDCINDSKPPLKPKPSSLEYLSDEVLNLRQLNEEQQLERKELVAKIASLQSQHAESSTQIDSLRKQAKIHERTCVVLEQPEENVPKLEALVAATQERRQTLHEQWQSYRQPLEQQLKELNKAKKAKNIHSLMDMRRLITELEQELSEKTAVHVQLNAELKSHQASTATRKEYTRRIHEFIGNIRKQSNDIYKVLDDTRDLQKQLNSVSAQLQRQFNYTDDLLFQSAKHDLHAKKAYKLLATLHANCTELIELVAHTGNVTKEIRDLEVQIDNERIKNVAHSLEQITADINKFESLYRELQVELQTLENEITAVAV